MREPGFLVYERANEEGDGTLAHALVHDLKSSSKTDRVEVQRSFDSR